MISDLFQDIGNDCQIPYVSAPKFISIKIGSLPVYSFELLLRKSSFYYVFFIFIISFVKLFLKFFLFYLPEFYYLSNFVPLLFSVTYEVTEMSIA